MGTLIPLGGAEFSPCRTYRYTLERRLGPGYRAALFIGLNPSTADEERNDPTIRREIGFARAWGCDWLLKANLFGLRSTDPRALYKHAEPVGIDNDNHILALAKRARGFGGKIICAWGVHGKLLGRAAHVVELLTRAEHNLHMLALTKDGAPKHPLYLRGDLKPQLWQVCW